MRIPYAVLVALALAGACACSKKSTEPAHAGSSGAGSSGAGSGGAGTPAATAELHVPLLDRKTVPADIDVMQPDPTFVVYRNKTFYNVGRIVDQLMFSPDGRPRVATSEEAKENGHWDDKWSQPLPTGTPVTPGELAASADERGVVILADGTTPVSEVVPAMRAAFTAAKKCWWIGVKYGVVATDPCGGVRGDTAAVDDDAVVLSLTIAGGKGSLSISHVDETTPFATLAELDRVLREQKASAFFADRTDLAIASTDAVTIADLVNLFAQLHAAGFTSAYLAHSRR